ncbi:unnamed protein product (macronuclear) [Paramecium tetraurelia]|uniref:Uncharacterized protein n=1 Tax=Paramecium tetraurelia TaxID=5888 RepID=A0CQW6_PARTE|nr:uncharacterized protein GSPATT00009532001 [Paramecium tetraurelia]CAK73183.1 unnamed protein product [Paramecium tetraurelia]|eukprot:XP_001440580.1 hypothetical protein (macronuclear) [Paramecium tetraurelia strain d4-2]
MKSSPTYEESLRLKAQLRHFLEKGNVEDPIVKTLFVWGSRPKDGESRKCSQLEGWLSDGQIKGKELCDERAPKNEDL